MYTASGYDLIEEGNLYVSEMTFILIYVKVFFIENLHDLSQYSIMVLAINIICYN